MKLVNYTPHTVMIRPEGGDRDLLLPPSGGVARVAQTNEAKPPVECDGVTIPRSEVRLGSVEGLPDAIAGVHLVVSGIVLAAAKAEGRTDCCAPDTGPSAIREEGRIVAVRGLVC